MKQIFVPRFNSIDLVGAGAVCIFISRGQFVLALLTALIGTAISVIGTNVIRFHFMNRQWQKLVEQDKYVAAIRTHRELFKTGLKEAKEAVDTYRSRFKA